MLLNAASDAGTVPWWSTILVTLGAIVLTSFGNWLLSNRQAKTQLALRRTELMGAALEARRKEKLDAFSAFIAAADAAWQAANDFLAKARAGTLRDYRDESRDVTMHLTKAYLDLLISGSEPTCVAAREYVNVLNEHMQRAARREWRENETRAPRTRLLDALRAELEPSPLPATR